MLTSDRQFSLLSNAPPPTLDDPRRTYARLPVRQTLVLDPWIEPVSSPGPVPSVDPPGDTQLLVLNSEELTFFDSHFSALRAACAAFAPSGVLTLVRAAHVSFSDLPALVPRALRAADERAVLRAACVLADAFLRRAVELGVPPERMRDVPGVRFLPMEVHWEGEGKERRKMLVGEEGDAVVHLF
jgi:platelet-activating factor acetylhydrolase